MHSAEPATASEIRQSLGITKYRVLKVRKIVRSLEARGLIPTANESTAPTLTRAREDTGK